ncbi:unnamed protein product [Caenorhabditis bovis]|uniref:Peroxisomal biogenesis factor 3 n=1 Tax=Caenorhabditis bovis TaxID=2654633 RepID=A0A8S1EI30_9PELO|nr:unnamed protein product [Caenorhabditis bovis]
MLSTAFEFAKRHKAKIIAGSVLLGGAIAYTLGVDKQKEFERPHLQNELPIQARRHYIFDATHRSCDQSITDLIPSITTQIEARFNLEQIRKKLDDPELKIENKFPLWETLLKNTLSRMICVAYGFSMLTLTLKAQISILAGETCANLESRTVANSWYDYLPQFLKSEQPTVSKAVNVDNAEEISNRRIFLQCIQYFTLKGIPLLMETVAKAVSEELTCWNMMDVKSKDDVRQFFDNVSFKVGTQNMFRKLVAPIDSDMDQSSSIIHLLKKLTSVLESDTSIHIFNSLLDFYYSAALKMVENWEQPVIRYCPAFANAYPVLTSTAFDSPLFNSLYSSDVHKFAVHVFNT